MVLYNVVFARSARAELESLDTPLIKKIFPKIEKLALNPRPAGCLKLQGQKNLWRMRIGDYRVIYAIHDERHLVDIIAVRHRREAYR